MALTDNTFTGEELKSAIAANPDLLPILKGTLTEQKFVVHDENEHATYLSTKGEEIKNGLTREHAEKLEADVLQLTGIPKSAANEKYYDYFKRATGEKLALITTMQSELDELKKGKSPSEIDKARIAELEKALETKTNEYTTNLSEKDKAINNMKLSAGFGVELAKIQSKYKADLPATLVKVTEDAIVNKLMLAARIEADGVITFPKEDGTPELNTSTYKPVTIEEKLKAELKDLIDEKKVVTGTGTKVDDIKKDVIKSAADFTGLPAGVDTQQKLTVHLKEIGILHGSEAFDEIFEKFGKDLKLR